MLPARSISITTSLAVVGCLILSTTRLIDGFAFPNIPSSAATIRDPRRSAQSILAAAKGFGSTPPPPTPKKPKRAEPSASPQVAVPPPSGSNKKSDIVDLSASASLNNPFAAATNEPPSPVSTSQGRAALDRMRRQRAEQRNEELQKFRDVRQVDQLVRESPEAAVIPERVAQRMGARMLPFVGIPLFGGMASFVGFWYMATYRDMEFQPALVATTTIALLAVGLVGITYSIMSASWDPDREGSFLGTDEFSQNLENIKSGLSRSRENAILRERMTTASFSQDELDSLDKKAATKKVATFQEKMGDEMDD